MGAEVAFTRSITFMDPAPLTLAALSTTGKSPLDDGVPEIRPVVVLMPKPVGSPVAV
jgi:hypothetical protein